MRKKQKKKLTPNEEVKDKKEKRVKKLKRILINNHQFHKIKRK